MKDQTEIVLFFTSWWTKNQAQVPRSEMRAPQIATPDRSKSHRADHTSGKKLQGCVRREKRLRAVHWPLLLADSLNCTRTFQTSNWKKNQRVIRNHKQCRIILRRVTTLREDNRSWCSPVEVVQNGDEENFVELERARKLKNKPYISSVLSFQNRRSRGCCEVRNDEFQVLTLSLPRVINIKFPCAAKTVCMVVDPATSFLILLKQQRRYGTAGVRSADGSAPGFLHHRRSSRAARRPDSYTTEAE